VIEGEILAILGPSGCGKSTLLSIIAGLETPDQGTIAWQGIPILDVPPHRRGFGLMFQDYALFPHMNVFENIAFGLKMAGMPQDAIQSRVSETLELVGLTGFAERDVNTLSGGEQQRVALARALAPRPRLLMFDEPLGSVDRTLRERLLFDLHYILKDVHQTALYVTHDQEEAFAIADRVILMRPGQVEQIGTPQEIYRQPISAFVANFLGFTNLFPGEIVSVNEDKYVRTPIGDFPTSTEHTGKATILIRPDAVDLDGDWEYSLRGRLTDISFRGSLTRAVIAFDRASLTFDFPTQTLLPAIGSEIEFGFDPGSGILIFGPENTLT
jgi:ABC-type Fe3+/spermidine/putrescine transport system ATPase subunit